MLNNLKKNYSQLSLRLDLIAWIFDWLFSFKSKKGKKNNFYDKI